MSEIALNDPVCIFAPGSAYNRRAGVVVNIERGSNFAVQFPEGDWAYFHAREVEPVPAVLVLPTEPEERAMCTPASPLCIGSERGGACSCNDDPEEKR